MWGDVVIPNYKLGGDEVQLTKVRCLMQCSNLYSATYIEELLYGGAYEELATCREAAYIEEHLYREECFNSICRQGNWRMF